MPTFQLMLTALLAFLESANGSFEAGIGSDQERGFTLIKVKGCTVGSLVGGLSGFMGKETVKGCWCLWREGMDRYLWELDSTWNSPLFSLSARLVIESGLPVEEGGRQMTSTTLPKNGFV